MEGFYGQKGKWSDCFRHSHLHIGDRRGLPGDYLTSADQGIAK